MKYIFGVFLLFIFNNQSFAQRNQSIVSIYNSDSTFVGTGIMKNGQMDGLWKFQNPKTNQLLQVINFDNGEREGMAISYHPTSNKHVEAEYRDNKLNGIFREYDLAGSLKLEMIFRDSIPVGPYKEYYGKTGNPDYINPRQLKKEGQFVNGKKDGRWLTYYGDGQLAIVETFKNGQLQGPYLEYSPDGQLAVEVIYKNNQPDGVFKRYSFDNIIGEQGEYKNGRRVGEWITYFPGTRVVASEKYYDQQGNRTGEWKYYYENRRLARIEKYENDIAVGTWEEYYPNRNLSKRKTYELGVPVGDYIEYHSNGNVSVTGKYVNGMKDGLWKSYFPDGQLYSIGEYKNDMKSGLWKYFNKIGILIAEGEYNMGSENGQWFYYYDGGQLKSVGSFFLGFEEGTWGLFYDNKQLTQEEYWSSGRLMNIGDYYNYDGSKTLDKGTLKDGNGVRITYYINEKKESEGTYQFGKPNGTWIYYHENGRKASEGQMVDGKKEGVWRYYNMNGRLEQVITFANDEVVPEREVQSGIQFNIFN